MADAITNKGQTVEVVMSDPSARPTALHHDCTLIRLTVHIRFLVRHILAVKQLLGTNAERAPTCGIKLDLSHAYPFTTGRLAPRQALSPPWIRYSSTKPLPRS